MDTSASYEAVTREQIHRYRAITSILSWAGKRSMLQPKNNISPDDFRYLLFNNAWELANLLVRDDEVVTVTSNVDGTKLRVIKLNNNRRSETAKYQPEAKGLESEAYCSDRHKPSRLQLPRRGSGQYLKEHAEVIRGTRNTRPALTIPSFSEHAAIVIGLLKESHLEHRRAADIIQDLAEYVYMAAEPAIRKRIAIGGAPQASPNKIYRRNIFWALSRSPEEIDRLSGDPFGKFPRGIRANRNLFAGRLSSLLRTSPTRNDLDPFTKGFQYDRMGRRNFQKVLSFTMKHLWRVFEEINLIKEEMFYSNYLRAGGDPKALLHEQRPESLYPDDSKGAGWPDPTRLAIELDQRLSEAVQHMRRLRHMVINSRAIMLDHLGWLQDIFNFRDTRTLCFDEGFFRDLNVALWRHRDEFWPPVSDPEGRDSSVLLATMMDAPSSPPVVEDNWVDAAICYLDRILRHQHSLKSHATRESRSEGYKLYAKTVSDMHLDVVDIVSTGDFDNEMLPAYEVLKTIKIRGRDIGESSLERLRLVLESQTGDSETPALYSGHAFQGQYHVEGLVISLHILGRMNRRRRAESNGHDQKGDRLPPDIQAAVDELSKRLCTMNPLLPASETCCCGCYALVKYANKFTQEEDPEANTIITPRVQTLWSPCTIPPWTPRAAAEFMIEEATKELEAWAEGLIPEYETLGPHTEHV